MSGQRQPTKTPHPLKFEVTDGARDAMAAWVDTRRLEPDSSLLAGRQAGGT